jgi:signal transduction histidine kinase
MGLAIALLRDPFLDPYCWRSCDPNPLRLISGLDTTRAVGHAAIGVEIALGLAVVALAAWRHRFVAFALPAAVIGSAAMAHAAAVWQNPLEGRHGDVFQAIYLVLATSVAALAAGTSWAVFQLRRTRQAIDRLVLELAEAPPPGGLQRALADALGDPTLAVHYWLPDSASFVDDHGKASKPPPSGSGQAVTSITRGGTLVALVSSDASLLDGADLERRIGSAARLAVENERLRAEVLARLAAVRESRARIVEAGDATRRRLERDLHDGAQQRLLALSYTLRLAHAQALSDGEEELAVLLGGARDDAGRALDDLRHLAQGIYPAVLTEAGLEAALTTLAEAADVPVELEATSLARLPTAVETTAYAMIAEAIDDASLRGASFVSVRAGQEDSRLVIDVEDDGRSRASPLTAVDDRVGAIGGSADAGPTSLRAVLPCA